jgi:hypothetical protein
MEADMRQIGSYYVLLNVLATGRLSEKEKKDSA